MGKRGPKPKRLVNETWTPQLAYAIGLLATDGCLSPPGHLINLTSKDEEQVLNFCRCIQVPLRIGRKSSGSNQEKKYFLVQMKNVYFYDFLVSVGLTPAKSKTLGPLTVPEEFFFDFLRGSFDGDGCFYSYWDPRWKSSFMFYLTFVSASPEHIQWLRTTIHDFVGVSGHISMSKRSNIVYLKYAKSDALKIIKRMYYSRAVICLGRKREKIEKALKQNNLVK